MPITAVGAGGTRSFMRSSKRNPLSVPNCFMWFDPIAANVTFNGPDVSGLANLGSGGNLSQLVVANQPLWVASKLSFGGRPAINYDGANHYLQSAVNGIVSASQSFTMFAVVESDNAGIAFSTVIACNVPQHYLYWTWFTADHGRVAGGVSTPVPGTTPSLNATILTWREDSVAKTIEVFENGISAGSAVFVNNANWGGTTFLGGVPAAFLFDGDIGETLGYDRCLSDDEVSFLVSYLNNRHRVF